VFKQNPASKRVDGTSQSYICNPLIRFEHSLFFFHVVSQKELKCVFVCAGVEGGRGHHFWRDFPGTSEWRSPHLSLHPDLLGDLWLQGKESPAKAMAVRSTLVKWWSVSMCGWDRVQRLVGW